MLSALHILPVCNDASNTQKLGTTTHVGRSSNYSELNPIKHSGVTQLHTKVFKAIQA